MKKKVVPTLRQEVKVKVDIVTSDDIKIYYTGKFQDFTARYIINSSLCDRIHSSLTAAHCDSYLHVFSSQKIFLPHDSVE